MSIDLIYETHSITTDNESGRATGAALFGWQEGWYYRLPDGWAG